MAELFDGIDLSLPGEQLAEWLKYVLDQRVELDSEDNRIVTICSEEVEQLQKLSREAGPKTRCVVAEFLMYHGPCSWDDLEAWILDSCKDVRERVIGDIQTFGDHTVGGRLCSGDRKRCVDLIARSCEMNPGESDMLLTELCFFATGEPGWLELTWEAANRLLDIDNTELSTSLVVCYFEHVIPDLGWGPDDPHIRPWIEGEDHRRQIFLLKIAAWCRFEPECLRVIVKALTHSKVKEIRALARGLVGGHLSYSDMNISCFRD